MRLPDCSPGYREFFIAQLVDRDVEKAADANEAEKDLTAEITFTTMLTAL